MCTVFGSICVEYWMSSHTILTLIIQPLDAVIIRFKSMNKSHALVPLRAALLQQGSILTKEDVRSSSPEMTGDSHYLWEEPEQIAVTSGVEAKDYSRSTVVELCSR